jgi:hypothetical protein
MAKITSLRNTPAGIGLAAVMLFAGAMGALILAGCDTEAKGPPSDLVCECEPTARYLPCDCPVSGTAGCECEVEPREIITLDGANIPIYQTVGVEDAAIAADVDSIIEGYKDSGQQAFLKNKIKEIRIVTTETKCTAVDSGKYIIEFQTGTDKNIFANKLIGWIGFGPISQIQSSARNWKSKGV